MKLLILSPDFPVWDGGVAVFAEKLATGFAAAGQQVTVLTPRQLPGDADFDRGLTYPVRRTRNVKDRYLKYLYAGWMLHRLFRSMSFDAVLSTTWFPYANAVLRSAPRTPLFLLAHGNDFLERRWRKSFWNRRMLSAFTRATTVIAVSNPTKKALIARIPQINGEVPVIFPAVDPAEFEPQPTGPSNRILLSLGRVVERKGQDMVIRALPGILAEFPDAEYWIAGRGAYLESLKNLARSLNVDERVRFLGFIDAKARHELYRQCAIYLMPSRMNEEAGDFEGFGITFLEANASGKAVIGGRSGGVVDAVIDGETGYLVDPQSPKEIAEKVCLLLRRPDLAAQFGRAGRARVETILNWSNTASQFLAVIEKHTPSSLAQKRAVLPDQNRF